MNVCKKHGMLWRKGLFRWRWLRKIEFWHIPAALKIHPTASSKIQSFRQLFSEGCLLFIASAERNVAIRQSSDQWNLTGVERQQHGAPTAAKANAGLL